MEISYFSRPPRIKPLRQNLSVKREYSTISNHMKNSSKYYFPALSNGAAGKHLVCKSLLIGQSHGALIGDFIAKLGNKNPKEKTP
jgi:hypothetical protein